MPARRSDVITSLSIVSALGVGLGIVTCRNGQAVQQKRYGRYTSHDVIELTLPILQAMLPNRDDLYIVTEHRQITKGSGESERIWNLDCTDGAGNPIVHITRDADTGRIDWLGYDWHIDRAKVHPLSLSSQSAAMRAQEWMHILGFNDPWQPSGAPQRHARTLSATDADWSVILFKPGWRAQLVMNEAAGTLVYANVVPTQNN